MQFQSIPSKTQKRNRPIFRPQRKPTKRKSETTNEHKCTSEIYQNPQADSVQAQRQFTRSSENNKNKLLLLYVNIFSIGDGSCSDSPTTLDPPEASVKDDNDDDRATRGFGRWVLGGDRIRDREGCFSEK